MSICGYSNCFSASPYCGCSCSPCTPYPYPYGCGYPCPGPTPGPGPGPGPAPGPGPERVSLSHYLEAVGTTQTVASNSDIVFDIDPDSLDIAGNAIQISSTGTAFTLTRPGLYHVEWSLNLATTTGTPVAVGLLENDEPASGMSNASPNGNFSSGALIQVTRADLPYVIRLHNFGVPLSLVNPDAFQNTAASIRILKFADGVSNS